MSTFAYTAVDASGKTIRGKMDADSEQLVTSKLHEQRCHIVSISRGKEKKKLPTIGSRKVKLKSMVIFSRQFATMINAGIAVVRCLDILEGQTKDEALKPAIAQCKRDVKAGLSLTDAFGKHPTVFSRLYINMVRAAETGGILDQMLDRLATFLEKEDEIRGKIKSAMIYPIVVLIFAGMVLTALFMFVLPKFKEIFLAMNVKMPLATRILFDGSTFLKGHWYMLLGILIGGFLAYRRYAKTERGRFQIDGLKLRVPVIGELVQKMGISRFSRTFATLIASGVPMMRSLEIVGDTSGNVVIAKAVDNARSAIREGQKISVPLAQSGLFPSMVTHMIDIGEETGRLSDMLIKVSDFYDQEVDAAVKALTSLVEPCLIVFMGGIVGFIAVSIMSPIFKLVSSIG
jgi:type IV pilus assembly protein PilC